MDETLDTYFEKLDEFLNQLGTSDSSVEYASQIREPFNGVVEYLNEIRMYLGGDSKEVEKYFELK